MNEKTSAPMVMPDTIKYLVKRFGIDKREAERQVRIALEVGWYDAKTYSIDYSRTGARWGKGRWTVLAD